MKTLQKPMEFSTFVTLLMAVEENYVLLREAGYYVKEQARRIEKNTRIITGIVRRSEADLFYPAAEVDDEEPKAA